MNKPNYEELKIQGNLLGRLNKGGAGAILLYRKPTAENGIFLVKTPLYPEGIERNFMNRLFKREFLYLKDLHGKSENIVKPMEFYDDAGRDYEGNKVAFSMEYIKSKNLKEIINQFKKSGKQIPQEYALFMFSKVLNSINVMHENSILNLDIKPSNVLVSVKNGEIKTIDLGLAIPKNEKPEVQASTLEYSSPEQQTFFTYGEGAEEIDEKSDTYSLGILLRELTTLKNPIKEYINSNRRPLKKTLEMNLIEFKKSNTKKIEEKIPRYLENIIYEATSPDKHTRPTVKEMKKEIDKQLGNITKEENLSFLEKTIGTSLFC